MGEGGKAYWQVVEHLVGWPQSSHCQFGRRSRRGIGRDFLGCDSGKEDLSNASVKMVKGCMGAKRLIDTVVLLISEFSEHYVY